MKKFMLLLALSTTTAMGASESITFNQIILKKTSIENSGTILTVNRDLKTWCMGLGSQLSIGTFEVAEKLNNLSDGLYSCEGKFVKLTSDHTTPVQGFEISSCTEVSAVSLKTDCPPKK